VNEAGLSSRRGIRVGDISLRWKLLLAFGVVLLSTSLLIGLAAFTMQEHRAADENAARAFQRLLLGNSTVASAIRSEANYRGYLLTGGDDFLAEYSIDVDTYTAQLGQLIDAAANPAQAERLRTIVELLALRRAEVHDPGIALRQRVTEGAASIDELAAYLQNEPNQDQLITITNLADLMREDEQARLQRRVMAAEDASTTLQRLLLFGGLGTIAGGLFLAWYILRDVSQPVIRLSAVARAIADGQLDRRIGWSRGDELGQMAASFDVMADRLQRLVHDQETALRSIQEHEAVVQAVMDSVAVGIVMVNLEGGVSIINRPACELLGIDATEMIGYGPADLQQLVARIFTDAAHVETTVGGDMHASDETLTAVFEQKMPEARHLEVYSTPVYAHDGKRLGRIYALRDVTREREIDRMKTEFVSMVSHELRTPLTSIKGYVDLLREGEVGELTTDQTEFLTIVATSTDRLVALINDLLDISRIEAGKVELKRERIDLVQSIQAAIASLRPQIEAKRQQLTVDVPPTALTIVADIDRIAQILTNLLSNAHKYTPVGKEIRVTAVAQGDLVEVSIIDTGIGLSQAEQSQLFTRFYRSSNRVVQEAGGTGLGLAITRSLVELHGGTIAVRSNPGQGSAFTFTLPLVTAKSGVTAPVARAGDERHILVVEDEPDIAGLLRRYLQRAGHNVVIAATAGDGFQAAKQLAPDLITLDVYLPDVDGFTLLDWLRGDQATRDIPVILVTILPDEGRGQLLGAVDHLTKPVDEAVLLERVRQILSRDGKFTILVADDDRDTRRLLVDLLRRAGHRTIEASDGAEAIAAASNAAHVDLALIDVRMPGADGLDALRALRSDAKTRDLPIVMMTASTGAAETSRSDIEALGATLVPKPLASGELAEAITKMLSRRVA
jgi:PAS domain S-box-containing protein